MANFAGKHPDIVGLCTAGADRPVWPRRSSTPGQRTNFVGQCTATIRALLALARGAPILREQEKIRIDIVTRDNLP